MKCHFQNIIGFEEACSANGHVNQDDSRNTFFKEPLSGAVHIIAVGAASGPGAVRLVFTAIGAWVLAAIGTVINEAGVRKMVHPVRGHPARKVHLKFKAEGITVLVRFDNLRLAEVYEKPFWDVSTDNWAAKYIQAAKDAGMLKYVERNVLRPKENLARSEAVEMLAKTSLAGGKIQDLYSWEKGFRRETVPERPRIRASIY